ncbi:Oxidoreductase BOA1 [Fusarium oxysporum f. sp. albedinis]|nr:Oxidoreductase BOA1 [Fusarium oxysporum f. sp. albedinis]
MSGIRTNGTNGTSCLHICVPNRFLIWSGHGWIAGLLKDLLHHQGKVYTTTIRMEDATRDKVNYSNFGGARGIYLPSLGPASRLG